jgi:lysozyme
MEISQHGINLIKEFEGFVPKAYICPAGKLSIGYGHVIKGGEKFPSSGISESEAQELLESDLEWVYEAIIDNVKVELRQCEFDALCSFIYNLGGTNFKKSTLLKFINQSDFERAAGQFIKWVNVNGKPSEGLKRRRLAEKQLFISED